MGDVGLPTSVLQAARGGSASAAAGAIAPTTAGDTTVANGQPETACSSLGIQEGVARTIEQMVSQMDLLTQTLQAMESRLQENEKAVVELVTEARARRAQA